MPAWAEARRLSQQIRAAHGPRNGGSDSGSSFLKQERNKYEKWWKPLKQKPCYFCRKHSNLSSGMLPGFGPIFKCADCAKEYTDLRQAIEEESR